MWSFLRRAFLLLAALVVLLSSSSRSQDYWLTLEKPTNKNLRKMCFVDTLTGWVAGEGGTILKTTSGGQTWTRQESHVEREIMDLDMLNDRVGWAISLVDTATIILKTTNGGDTWENELYPWQLYLAIHFMDSLHGVLGGLNSSLLHTSDGGLTWVPAVVESTVFADVLNFEFLTPAFGYALGGRRDVSGTIWRTTDGGSFWTVTELSTEPFYDVHFFDEQHAIGAGGDFDYGSSVVSTTDGGASWEYTYLGYFGIPTAIAFRTNMEGWAPLSFNRTFMYTLDGGETWLDRYSPDSTAIYDVQFLDTRTGYAVGDGGVVLKYNAGIVSVAPDEPGAVPSVERLEQNYPNPFNPSTTIDYTLSASSDVRLTLHDITGKEVMKLVDARQPSGAHQVKVDGSSLASGIYFYRIKVRAATLGRVFLQTRKMLLIR